MADDQLRRKMPYWPVGPATEALAYANGYADGMKKALENQILAWAAKTDLLIDKTELGGFEVEQLVALKDTLVAATSLHEVRARLEAALRPN